jgi:hypothetical protein
MATQIAEQLRFASFTAGQVDHLLAIPEFNEACAVFDGSEEQLAHLVKLGGKLLFETKYSAQNSN